MKILKDSRVQIVISEHDKQLIEEAALKIDVSISELFRKSALIAAKKILATDNLEIQVVSGENYDPI
jgi:uncharacterized protein (DUF1778 family)